MTPTPSPQSEARCGYVYSPPEWEGRHYAPCGRLEGDPVHHGVKTEGMARHEFAPRASGEGGKA